MRRRMSLAAAVAVVACGWAAGVAGAQGNQAPGVKTLDQRLSDFGIDVSERGTVTSGTVDIGDGQDLILLDNSEFKIRERRSQNVVFAGVYFIESFDADTVTVSVSTGVEIFSVNLAASSSSGSGVRIDGTFAPVGAADAATMFAPVLLDYLRPVPIKSSSSSATSSATFVGSDAELIQIGDNPIPIPIPVPPVRGKHRCMCAYTQADGTTGYSVSCSGEDCDVGIGCSSPAAAANAMATAVSGRCQWVRRNNPDEEGSAAVAILFLMGTVGGAWVIRRKMSRA